MRRQAAFDASGRYRFSLRRIWNGRKGCVVFIMLNPSSADAVRDDSTIRRCVGFARTWGFGSLEVLNLFAYRTPFPSLLRRTADPVGAGNDAYLIRAARRGDRVVAAWGNGGKWLDRERAVARLLAPYVEFVCLGQTLQGAPRHPLYLPSRARLRRWTLRDVDRATRTDQTD